MEIQGSFWLCAAGSHYEVCDLKLELFPIPTEMLWSFAQNWFENVSEALSAESWLEKKIRSFSSEFLCSHEG